MIDGQGESQRLLTRMREDHEMDKAKWGELRIIAEKEASEEL